MTGLLIGLAVYVVSLGHWPAAVALGIAGVVATRWLGRQSLLIAAASLLSAWWIGMALPPPLPQPNPQAQGWRLEVDSMPQLRMQGWDFEARVLDGGLKGYRLLIYTSDPESVVIGDRIYTYGTVIPRDELGAGFGRYLDGRGVSGQMFVGDIAVDEVGSGIKPAINRFRQETISRLIDAVPGDAGALLAGFVTGDDGQLSEQSDTSFRNAGLSHLTAVSGANLGMLVAMVAALGRGTGRTRFTRLVGGVAVAWAYALFAGLSPPTFRAALLTTVVASGRLAGRPIDMLTLAFSTVALQLTLRPTDAYSISFHLSTAASIGLAAGLNRYPPGERRLRLVDLVAVAAIAQLATLPFIVSTFGEIPTLSIVANIVAVPLATFAFAVAMAGAGLLWLSPSLGEAMLIPAAWAADGVLAVARLYGQEWSVIEVDRVSPFWLAAGLIAALLILLHVGGDLSLARRQLRLERAKTGSGG